MGQYYRAVLIEKDENGVRIIGWLWRRGSLKLMEHSWLGNEFVRAIEYQISPEGPYPAGVRIVWAGDYADTEEDTGMNIYHMCDDNDGDGGDLMLYFPEHDNHDYRFVVNHSKRLFVDKETIQEEDDDDKGWKIHPLPLLTCEGQVILLLYICKKSE